MRRFSSTGSSLPPASMDSRNRIIARSASSSEIASSRFLISSNSEAMDSTVVPFAVLQVPATRFGIGASGVTVVTMEAADVREWVSFTDADGSTWHFDLTFLTSNYGCIYGRGCQGVLTEPAPEYEHGCCSYGAHFVGEADRSSIEAQIARLSVDEWQFAREAEAMGGAVCTNDDGETVTQMIDGACIMLNRVGFPKGSGCALHQGATARGERTIDWKPDVCWQVPLRYDAHTEDGGHINHILREWKRRDWGEGGAEFAWWCTDDPSAFGEDRPVWKSLRSEIVELVGSEQYERLVDHIMARDQSDVGGRVLLPHPQVRRSRGSSDDLKESP